MPVATEQQGRQIPLWINGEDVVTSKVFDVQHPSTGKVSSKVCGASEDDVTRAIEGARAAFPAWAKTPAATRRDILFKVAALMEAKKDELATAYSHDTNASPMIVSFDLGAALTHMKSGATIATEVRGEIPQTSDGSLALVTREPYGVVFSVCPFNMGLVLCVRTFCYALACGNTVVIKASPAIPFLHYSLGAILKEAGVPDGVVQILQFAPGTEPERTEQIIAHPHIRMANFTGSTKVGSIIGSLCGKYIKPCLLELGGKAPILVLESADLKMAANNIVFGALLHSGQICMSTERVVVVESVADKLVEEIQAIAKNELPALGHMELASKLGVEKMDRLVNDALSKGAKRLTVESVEDKKVAEGAHAYLPVILDNVKPDQDIYYQETFGPGFVIIRAKDTEDAVRIANDNEAGLSASVWTRDYKEALDVARSIESGAVHINGSSVHDEPNLPHGGMKTSGFGRFNGMAAIQAFTQTKAITMHEPHALPIAVLK
ncbi:hypothetical protein QFC24_004395 [Naganishia onofrii]|uniref:Uncharacterized protein n=1 Tax=Naganishia onofrii TaxID=1851511 RepID=A0ACC2XE27_9TREE|nr:hypothetical protein QFC24_004395 [Naganishia onofrii]